MCVDTFLDVIIKTWQFKRGGVSFAEVISACHVVDLPLLCVSVEGYDNPIIQSTPAKRPFHLASRRNTLSGDIQRSSMLLEVYKCVQLNIWFVVCGCVLQRWERGSGFRRLCVGMKLG